VTKPAVVQAPSVQEKTAPAKQIAAETKKPVVPPPVAVTQSALPPVKTEPKPATAAPTPQATAPPASLAPVKTTATVAGAYVLQIGAYKSDADASAAWKVYQAKHAALLSGVSSNIQKADLGDKGVWYRLRAGSFAEKNTAAALCDKLKADGGACFPAK
jgi:cell division protein FtsN